MIVMGLEIPRKVAEDAQTALLSDGPFRLASVTEHVSASLRGLARTGAFSYGDADPARVHDRTAERILHEAHRQGRVRHLGGGRWTRIETAS